MCEITILSVCTGAIEKSDAEILLKTDLVWSCASKYINEVIGPRSIFTTRKIKPIYALTDKGKAIILAGAKVYSNKMYLYMEDETDRQPHPMI
ncbi:hypothetical protein DK846_01875 [Methanospirillum lacunae]|uniref:Uncharacterized protein n=1 Tax=Methanospirillum lacunae TaxID=668570 RepID=A0A2V2NBU7_9EURY|nr:hypothetical protein DK846_01875 [Methanospirillum lacunae]